MVAVDEADGWMLAQITMAAAAASTALRARMGLPIGVALS
jgi:hypothetical protein